MSSESGTDYKLEKSSRANGCSHSPVCRFTTDIWFLNKAALTRKQPNRSTNITLADSEILKKKSYENGREM